MNARRSMRLAVAVALALAIAGCYRVLPSSGGGQVAAPGPRAPNAADVALATGYTIEVVARGLTFPTGVAFDGEGRPHVVESGYSYGEVFTTPRLLRVDANGTLTRIAEGSNNGPWTGVAFHNGRFYVAEGGVMEGGRILRIAPDGTMQRLVENLPSFGDHHTNGPAVAADGTVYFMIGTATNSAVVGLDNAKFGWLKRRPQFHDIPCRDVTLAGHNHDTPAGDGQPAATTGAYVPFGTPTRAGQVVNGQVPCSGAVLRVAAGGGAPELVAWGLRNPFGIAFAPDGQLYVTENNYDDRGSRPVWGAPDVMWRIQPGTWYGWPDFAEGRPVTDSAYDPPTKPKPRRLLERAPGTPPQPVARFAVHASANGFDF
jgi:glucose/arabinose dehydrogenase